jgi:transposase-like protein
MSRKKYDEPFKRKVIQEYEAGGISCYGLGQKYGVDAKCVRSWCRLYKQFGDDYLTNNHSNVNFTAEFKQQVVISYLEGGKTYQSVATAYGILSPTTVRQWVMMYNNHEELTNSRPEGLFDMVKNNTRKTTFDERIKIVEYCVRSNNNYALTAKEFNVSYGQVYSWVRKYNADGADGLLDRRGKQKSEESLSEQERLQIEIRILRAENKNQQMEIDFLKKLEEIERRRF